MANAEESTPESSLSKSLVMMSLSGAMESTVPLVLSESSLPTLRQLEEDHLSSNKKKSGKLRLPDLLKPRQRMKSDSETDESPTSPTHRWRSPHIKRRKLRVRGDGKKTRSADNSPNRDRIQTPETFETTPVASLPGQQPVAIPPCIDVPTIMVSPDEQDDHMRKISQSSRLSVGSSTMTSGVGSLLSPSGDEDCSISDGESFRSPLSTTSSMGGSQEELTYLGDCDTLSSSPAPTDGEMDYIEEDYHPSSPSHAGSISQNLTIPPAQYHSSKNTKGKKKEKHKWEMLKKCVQWAPFIQVYRKKYPWVQLAGHQGNFSPGEENGTIMKKSSEDESKALQSLMDDILRPFVPEFRREVIRDSDVFIEMADLLRDFDEPAVMDIKMGKRTYLERELGKSHALRPDMYDKMVAVDPNEPTPEENEAKAISKPRYMQWRETLSSTATLGFRIEGIKMSNEKPMKEEFKTVCSREDVLCHLRRFTGKKKEVKRKFLERLMEIRAALEKSVFFQSHEVIGSSLLFVFGAKNQATIHMIDFGKTVPIPEGVVIDHRAQWVEGNHEDGYLTGLDNLIEIWDLI